MRDGTLLSTVVYIPGRNTTGKFPAVIDRSPYGHVATELLALLFCPLGFVAVMQDMRGSGDSEGEFAFWRTDGPDTFDTLAWIEQQEVRGLARAAPRRWAPLTCSGAVLSRWDRFPRPPPLLASSGATGACTRSAVAPTATPRSRAA